MVVQVFPSSINLADPSAGCLGLGNINSSLGVSGMDAVLLRCRHVAGGLLRWQWDEGSKDEEGRTRWRKGGSGTKAQKGVEDKTATTWQRGTLPNSSTNGIKSLQPEDSLKNERVGGKRTRKTVGIPCFKEVAPARGLRACLHSTMQYAVPISLDPGSDTYYMGDDPYQ